MALSLGVIVSDGKTPYSTLMPTTSSGHTSCNCPISCGSSVKEKAAMQKKRSEHISFHDQIINDMFEAKPMDKRGSRPSKSFHLWFNSSDRWRCNQHTCASYVLRLLNLVLFSFAHRKINKERNRNFQWYSKRDGTQSPIGLYSVFNHFLLRFIDLIDTCNSFKVKGLRWLKSVRASYWVGRNVVHCVIIYA